MPATDLQKSARIIGGKYKVVRLLGEGGMGEVFEAENVWTARRVALKVLRQELAHDQEIVDRFVQEGRSTTMIPHPNIVDVLDMGREEPDGAVYMVQEFLIGMGLDRLLELREAMPVRDTLDIMVPIMGGLTAAHRRGVVHRDVKPENIILAQTPRGSIVPKLIDFGIAKLVSALRPGITERGTLMGTPHYMSPEQLEGADLVDHRADVWAIGVMLYEMLAGRYPFDADNLPRLCIEICTTTPRFLKEVEPRIPTGLCEIIHRALVRDPEQRCDSMETFIESLLSCRALGETTTWLAQRHSDAIPYRRRHPRFAVNWTCEIVCDHWERALSLVSQNISRGGVFVPSHQAPEIGSQVQIELRLPDGSHLRLEGTVIRVVGAQSAQEDGSPGFAVHFAEAHSTDLLVLEQIAAAHQEPGYEPLPETALDSIPSIDLSDLEIEEELLAAPEPSPPRRAHTVSDTYRDIGRALAQDPKDQPVSQADQEPVPEQALEQMSTDQVEAQSSERADQPPIVDLPPMADPLAHTAAHNSVAPIVDRPRSTLAPPPPPQPRSAPRHTLATAAGIDFGTTFGSISIALDDQVYSVPDAKQRTLHPSVVCYPERGQPIVGWDARRYQLHEPKRTVTSVKRVLGRTWDEPLLQGFLHGLPVECHRGESNDILFEIDGSEVAPIQVAAEQLDFLRRLAETRTGRPLSKVVISVPVTASERQEQALLRAASIAGLEVLELIGEPIAAVTAYGFGQGRRETVAVYDFGGGTFDFSIVELLGNKHKLIISQGDAWLGGEDFDYALAEEAANRFWHDTGTDLRQRAVEWQRLLFASEQAKRQLSLREDTELVLPRAVSYPESRDLRWTLDRLEFERLSGSIVHRTLGVCRSSLQSAGLRTDRIDRIVITGGTSRIPFLQRELAQFFGKPVTAVIDPEQSVCIGTGLRAAVLTRHRVKQAARKGS
jgi:serine/threonine protein kinase/actin-like ATPase involved in cell morphogenesis